MNGILKKYDRWTWERIRRHIAYWAAWGLFYVVLNYSIKTGHSFWAWASFELIVIPIKVSCSYFIAYFLMPRFLNSKKYELFLLTASLSFLFFGLLLYLEYNLIVQPYIMNFQYKSYSIFEFTYKAIELVYITGLVVAIKFFQNLLYQEQRNHQLQEEKVRAELRFLKNQIQPHFLFNTLNNLYGMVLSGDQHAATSIVKLSDMLEYMLYDSDTDQVPLEAEIEHLENYIALEQLRYARKLDLDYRVEGKTTGWVIAPLLLLPFVENAFKHGPAKEEGRSSIAVVIKIQAHRFTLEVRNTYSEDLMDASIRSGIGLKNVRKRLELLYPGRYQLSVDKGAEYKVTLVLNLNPTSV